MHVDKTLWDRLEAEFMLPALEQVQARLASLHNDPEPLMRQLVRVFIGDGTYCPGFQFRDDGSLHPVVISLFHRPHRLLAGGPAGRTRT